MAASLSVGIAIGLISESVRRRQSKNAFTQEALEPESVTQSRLEILPYEEVRALAARLTSQREQSGPDVGGPDEPPVSGKPAIDAAGPTAPRGNTLEQAMDLVVLELLKRSEEKEKGAIRWAQPVVAVVIGVLTFLTVLVPSMQMNPRDCAAVLDSIVAAKQSFPSIQLTNKFPSVKACGLDASFFDSLDESYSPSPGSGTTTTAPPAGS